MTADPTIDALVAEYCTLADQLADITARLERVKAGLRLLGTGRHTSTSGVAVTVTPQRRFNTARALDMLTVDQVAACQDFSAAKAKQVLAPLTYKSFMDESGEPRIVVR